MKSQASCNTRKTQLIEAMREIDAEKTGMIKSGIFLNLLQCTDFYVEPQVINDLVSRYSSNGNGFYERIFNMLAYDKTRD